MQPYQISTSVLRDSVTTRKLRPLVHSMRVALTSLALAGPALTCIQQAQAQNTPVAEKTYAISAGPLSAALKAFAMAADITLSFNPDQTRAQYSRELQGTYTVDAGLARLLTGSGLEAVRQTNGSYTLRPASAALSTPQSQALPVVTVNAANERATEGSGSYTAQSMGTATKFNLSQRETPQSISVVTRQQLDDRGFQSLEEVAQDATGLTTRQIGGAERTQFFSRGFEIRTFLADGVPLTFDYDTQGLATIAMYDRIEIIRGAAGIVTGTGNPSGAINMIRKRPTRDVQVSLTGSGGSWNNYRSELDAAGPLNAAGTLRGRLVVAAQDSDTFQKAYSHHRQLIYGTVEMDLGRDTLLSVGGYYNKEDNPGANWNGLPTRRDGSFYPFDRSTRMSPDWAYWNKENSSVFTELEHRFENGWKGVFTVRGLQTKMDMLGTYLYLKPTGEDFGQGAGKYAYQKTQYSIDGYLSGPFSLLGRKHELVVGGSYREAKDNDGPGGWPSNYDEYVDPNTWNSSTIPQPAIDYLWSRRGTEKQSAIYGTVRLNLADPLTLMLGARIDSYEYNMHLSSGSWQDDTRYKVDNKFTPYAGVLYNLDDNHTLYTSWTSVFQPQSNQAINGSVLAPVTGSNLEAGVKAEYFGGRLNASAAVFQIRQNNLPLSLDSSLCQNVAASCYSASGEVQSRGVEFEMAGAITPGWQVMAGYTYYSATYLSDADAGKAGSRFDTQTPRHLLKVSTSYQFPGALQQWKIGGALRTRSETTKPEYNIRQGGYTLLDLMASYQVNKNLDIRLNLYNVFDKYYYQTIGSTQDNNHFGAPRNFLLTAKYTF